MSKLGSILVSTLAAYLAYNYLSHNERPGQYLATKLNASYDYIVSEYDYISFYSSFYFFFFFFLCIFLSSFRRFSIPVTGAAYIIGSASF